MIADVLGALCSGPELFTVCIPRQALFLSQNTCYSSGEAVIHVSRREFQLRSTKDLGIDRNFFSHPVRQDGMVSERVASVWVDQNPIDRLCQDLVQRYAV